MKADPEIYGRAVAMYKHMEADGLRADLERSGITVRSASEDTDSSPWWKELTPEKRRAWRLIWAREAVRGHAVGCHSGCGGELTKEELKTARLILDGELKPTKYTMTDCAGNECSFSSLAEADAYCCADPDHESKTNHLGHHFLDEMFPVQEHEL